MGKRKTIPKSKSKRGKRTALEKLSTRRAVPKSERKPQKKKDPHLTQKQMLFVEAYVQSSNGYQSAMAAGYKPSSSAVTAHNILSYPHVQAAIARRREQMRREIELRGTMSKDWLLSKLHDIINSDPADIATFKGKDVNLKSSDAISPDVRKTLQSITSGRHGPSFKTADRIRAAELAATILGYKTDRHEHSGPGGSPIQFYLPENGKRAKAPEKAEPDPKQESEGEDA